MDVILEMPTEKSAENSKIICIIWRGEEKKKTVKLIINCAGCTKHCWKRFKLMQISTCCNNARKCSQLGKFKLDSFCRDLLKRSFYCLETAARGSNFSRFQINCNSFSLFSLPTPLTRSLLQCFFAFDFVVMKKFFNKQQSLCLLQVSYFSTSPELSNKQRFEYFSRTIPSDHYQVKAMVEIVKSMGWTYVSIIYEESNYGIKVSCFCSANPPNSGNHLWT